MLPPRIGEPLDQMTGMVDLQGLLLRVKAGLDVLELQAFADLDLLVQDGDAALDRHEPHAGDLARGYRELAVIDSKGGVRPPICIVGRPHSGEIV